MKDRLEELSRNELIVIARKLKIKGCWRMKKIELIESMLTMDPNLIKKQLNLSALDKIITPLTILLAVLGIAATILVSPLFLKNDNNFGSLEGVEIRKNILIAFDKGGKQWRKNFESKISRHVVSDINRDGKVEVILGFAEEGKEYSHVIALNQKGEELWTFLYEPECPYPGAHGGGLSVFDLKVFLERDKKIIIVLFGDSPLYRSTLVVLNPLGEKLKEFRHPGRMHQVEKIKDVFVIRAVNNDFPQTSISKDSKNNPNAIFGLTYENIYGEAPPHLGSSIKNINFEWYYVLSDQEEKFNELIVSNEKIIAQTNCGKMFYFNKRGKLNKVGYTDSYSCKKSLRLIKLVFTEKEVRKMELSTTYQNSDYKKIKKKNDQLLRELIDKSLLDKIKDARAYHEEENVTGRNKALQLYREVITKLSPKALGLLNQKLLGEAEDDFRNKNFTHALRKYEALFKEFYKQP